MDLYTVVTCGAVFAIGAIFCFAVTKIAAKAARELTEPAPDALREPSEEELMYFRQFFCPVGSNIYSKKLNTMKSDWMSRMMVCDGNILKAYESRQPDTGSAVSNSYDIIIGDRIYANKDYDFVTPGDYKDLFNGNGITGYFVKQEDGDYYYLTFSKKVM